MQAESPPTAVGKSVVRIGQISPIAVEKRMQRFEVLLYLRHNSLKITSGPKRPEWVLGSENDGEANDPLRYHLAPIEGEELLQFVMAIYNQAA